MRFHIRHSLDMTIHCMTLYTRVDSAVTRRTLKDVSEGGLCFKSHLPFVPQSVVHLRIPVQHPPVETTGVVAWCRRGEEYEIGVRFKEPPVELLRMVGLACRIKHYTRLQRRSGRMLSTDQAAREWISRYAGIVSDQAA